MANVDYFLKLEGIDGESTDDKHKGEIDVESFSWGVMRPSGPALGASKAGALAAFQDLSFTSLTSRASPPLFLACASGRHLKQAVLTVARSDEKGRAEPFMTFVFNDVLVSGYQVGAGDLPLDSSSLSYASVLVNSVGTRPPAPAEPILIGATGSGALVRYMDEKTTEIAPSRDGDLLQSGYVHQVFGNLSIPRQFRRGVAEFDLSQTVVAGIAKGPGASKAKYELVLTNVTLKPSDGGGEVISDPGLSQPGEVGPGQHDVLWWEGPDLEVTTADYDRDVASLGKISSTSPGASHAFDVTKIVGASASRMLGFRIQLVDDPDRTGFASIGSEFSAELRLTLT